MSPSDQDKWNAAGKDVVVLHMFKRALYSPNISMYPMKLETWLRMKGIRYVTDVSVPQSPDKGQTPWITLNGENVADSQFAMDHLQKELNIEPNQGLTEEQKGIATGLRFSLEELFYWCFISEAFIRDRGMHVFSHFPPKFLGFPPWFMRIVQNRN